MLKKIYLDIVLADDTLEDLHNAIFNSFGFDGMEVASFYTCDETWNQEDEISLLTLVMLSASRNHEPYMLSELVDEKTQIIYVYDFINMWTFLVELAAVEDQVAGNLYPETLFHMEKCLMKQKKKTLKQMILRANLKTI
jgi:hypothetical protein